MRSWWIGVLLAVPVYVARAWPSLWTTVDDAWISARYAWHAAEGHGLVYSAGEPPVEGYTNLLWTLWLALGHLVGLPPVGFMVGSGLALGCASVALAGGLARTLTDRVWAPGLAALLVALDVHHAVVSTNGLETSLFVAGVLGAGIAAHTARGRALLPAGAGFGLLAAVRPEGALVGGLLACAAAMARWREPDGRAQAARVLGGTAAVWGVLFAWRYATYGAFVPNTFAAKATGGLLHNLPANALHLTPDAAWWIGAATVGLVAAALGGRDARRATLALAAIGLVAVAFRVQMWMPGGRLLVPSTAIVACLAAAAPGRAGVAVAAVALIGSLLAPLSSIESTVRRYDEKHSVVLPNGASEAARHLAAHAPPGAWLAVRDAGVLAAFVGTGVKVAELHDRALTLPHVDRADLDLALVPLEPELIALTQAREDTRTVRYGNDRKVFRRAKSDYRYLGRVYQHHHRYYDLYARADLDIPPLPAHLVVNRYGPEH